MRNSFNMAQRIEEVGWQHLSISEITVAELLYGAERSNNIEKNYRIVQSFCREINVIPLSQHWNYTPSIRLSSTNKERR